MSAVMDLGQKSVQFILDEWDAKIAVANTLMTAMRDASKRDTESSIDGLEKVASELDLLYQEANRRALEKKIVWKYFSYEQLRLGATFLNGGVQLFTATFLTKAVVDEENRGQNSWIAGAATAVTIVTSWLQTKACRLTEIESDEKLELEKITANRDVIEHIRSVSVIKKTAKQDPEPKHEEPKRIQFRIPIRQFTRLGNPNSSLKVLVQTVIDGEISKRAELRKEYVVSVICGAYKILSEEKIEELTGQYKRQKRVITALEQVIRESRSKNSDGDVRIIFDQLDELSKKLEEVFFKSTQLRVIYEELEKSKVKYTVTKFGVWVQLVLELGSLTGTIIDGVAAVSGATNTAVRIASLSVYVINSVFSYLSAKISAETKKNSQKLQQIELLQADHPFLDGLNATIARERQVAEHSVTKGAGPGAGAGVGVGFLSRVEAHRKIVLDGPPSLGAPGSPLQQEILRLYQKTYPEHKEIDWRQYLDEGNGSSEIDNRLTLADVTPVCFEEGEVVCGGEVGEELGINVGVEEMKG